MIENIFFFGLFGFVGYLIWRIVSPFFVALALAAIIAVVWYPIFARIVRVMPRKNKALASLISVFLITVTIFAPLFVLGYLLFVQIAAFYEATTAAGTAQVTNTLGELTNALNQFLPGFSFDVAGYLKQMAGWLVSHFGDIFAGTASTVFMLFIMLIALYYMLKDGSEITQGLVRMSPLQDAEDAHILKRLSISIRSVMLGTLAVALVQGILTAVGFTIFGMEQPILWGSVAAVAALIPGVGTSIVFVSAVVLLLSSHAYGVALGLGIWGVFAVGLIDNLLGPYLMGRGAELHPFMVLMSVLGGVALFGPLGFLLGPVALSLFSVLLELYSLHVRRNKKNAG